nr:hypothetical protein [Tanacetum cinerariifolium]
MKEKGDPCILVGYSTQSKGYHVYNKRTRLIVESIHLKFDEIKKMSAMSVANDTSGIVPQRQKASDYDNSDLENNDNQAEDKFTNPFCTPIREVVESPSRSIVQTRRQLATDPEMYMFALTVSTTEPSTIKEVVANSSWIEAMQEELHQFDRL